MRYWTECREFFQQFRQQYATTGSVLPSGRALARALTRPMRMAQGPRRILEVGPGTGAVTREIVRHLRPGDTLDVVEINGDFIKVLERRFEREPTFRRRRDLVRLIHAPLQEVAGERDYDFMISGLPLNNFPLSLVEEIFDCYRRLLRPEGTLSYFEYAGIRTMKTPFVQKGERVRLLVLSSLLERQIRQYQVAEEVVLLNVPPAVARHFRFGGRSRACLDGGLNVSPRFAHG